VEVTRIATHDGNGALVTGASSGIGAEIAITLAAQGAHVAAVGRDAGRLEATLHAIEAAGGQGTAITADLTEEGAATLVVAQAIERLGRLDTLVNAAGIFRPGEFLESVASFDLEWAINVRAPYRLTAEALPHLRETQGSVLFISSVIGRVGAAECVGYCTTKGAVENLVRALAVEEAVNDVRINAIAPGEVRTRLNEEHLKNPEYEGAVLACTPLKRVGVVGEIAPAAAFLTSDAAGYITGESLAIDGGWGAQ